MLFLILIPKLISGLNNFQSSLTYIELIAFNQYLKVILTNIFGEKLSIRLQAETDAQS